MAMSTVIHTPDHRTAASPDPPESPGALTNRRFTVGDFLTVLFKYKWVVLLTFLGTVLGTLTWLWIRSDSYETSGKIVIKFTREVADPRTSLSASTTRVLPPTRPDINTEAELIKSYALVEQVVTTMHLDRPSVEIPPAALLPRAKYELRHLYHWVQDAIDDLQVTAGLKEALTDKEKVIVELIRGLKVESVKDSSVVNVSLTSPIKHGAGSVLNTFIDLYRKRRLAVGRISGKVDFFDQQARIAEQRLHAGEEQLQSLKDQFDISSMPEQTSLILKSLSEAERNARETADEVRGAEAKASLLGEQLKSVSPTLVTSQLESRNLQLDQLSQKKADLELERQRLLAKYDQKSIQIEDVDRQIQRVTQLLADTDHTVQQSQTTSENSNYVGLQKELLTTTQFLASARVRLQGQLKAVRDYETQLRQLRRAEVTFNELSREIMLDDETYRLNQRNAVEAKASEALDSHGVSSIEVVDPAVDPILASGIRKTYLMGGAIALGLLLAICLAFFFEGLDSSVDSADDVEACLGRPMWGSVLLARKSKLGVQLAFLRDRRAVLTVRTNGHFARTGRGGRPRFSRESPNSVSDWPSGEDFAAIAAKLTSAVIEGRTHVFVMQGASAGAGATTVTIGMARALAAEFARRTLVVSPDSGSVMEEFLDHAGTFRELHLGNVPARLYEVTPNLGVLTYATSGRDPVRFSPSEIVSALSMVPDYEFVLVDAPESLAPYLRTQLGRGSEGVIVVAEWGETRGEILSRLNEEARRDGVRILAGVLNKRKYLIPEPIYRLL
jgi:uncharacterized protein involved in exopolysaccharide biosynthesis